MSWFILSFGALVVLLLAAGLFRFYKERKDVLENRKELKNKRNRYRTEEEFIDYPK
jgi:uncharacterized membrane protein YqjE